MDNQLVSVVIPTYSRPAFLERTINSVVNQTYGNIEIIVVDDNNPGTEYRRETEEVMNKFKQNSKVKYIKHEKNKNGSAARNTGWMHSKGKYITFLDDDDVISQSKIEAQVKCLEKLDDSWGMCYTKYELKKENGEYQISNENREGYLYVESLMRTVFLGSGSNLMLRKKVVDEIGGYDESFKRNQDIECLVRACERYKIAYIDKKLLTIYQEGNRKKRTLEEIEDINKHYLTVFKNKIDSLCTRDRKRVISVISLERFRVALAHHNAVYGIKILIQNKVSIINFFKYMLYLFDRLIHKTSCGFVIK